MAPGFFVCRTTSWLPARVNHPTRPRRCPKRLPGHFSFEPHHFVDHENGHSLDNRRANEDRKAQLRWLTAVENMENQRGIRTMPLTAQEAAIEAIPF